MIEVSIENEWITMDHAETLLGLENSSFLCFGTDNLNKPSEVLYSLFKEGFIFQKNINLFKIFWEKTEIFRIDFNQRFCKVAQISPQLSLFVRNKVCNGINLMPDNMSLIIGNWALSKEEIIKELL